MYFLFDIGGTHIRAALSDGDILVSKKIINTPLDYAEGVAALTGLKEELMHHHTVDRVLCGIAGVLHSDKQSLFVSPNLPDWAGKPLRHDLEGLFSLSISLENDAALAGLGEAVYGSGKDQRIVMYYTIGTGIGGARIVDKRIDAHTFGFEPGQQIVSLEKTVTIETLTSGGAIEKLKGMNPSEISDPVYWQDITKNLSVGIYNSLLHWSPDVIVVGGGLINQNVISTEEIKKNLQLLNRMYPQLPDIRKSLFGDESGLMGGIAYLNSL